ncbi:MAG: sensor histidine kinase [Desulfuromonas sp.]|nr:MAG: sensor histidine kinase [Desulfuromonas sp.]
MVLLATISGLHYLTTTQHDEAHDIYRRLYYIPIVLGGMWFALRGGVSTALVASVIYMPHVLYQWNHSPEIQLEQYLEIVLYNVIGFLTGFLTKRERDQQLRYKKTAEHLDESYRTLRKQADQIIEIEEQLRRADRLSALGELSAGMAHEIRNPLGAIRGTAEILREDVAKDDPKYEFAEILIREVERLNGVLEDFLRFARPAPIEPGFFQLNLLVREVLDLVRQQASNSHVELNFKAGEIDEIPGQAEQIRQALLNLILNALQAMPDGGRLTVATRLVDNQARIVVADSGQGIAEEDRQRIFNPFVTTRSEGTGLGLAITQRIVQGHSGHIELVSRPGAGATFTVCLPAG